MILLDTNVISEMMKAEPDAAVRAWLNAQAAETLYLSSVTLAELLFGIQNLPHGKRRDGLDFVLKAILDLFQGRILPFDAQAARHYAGKGFPTPDGYIAAIAASRHYIVASRDTAPYEAANVRVINPWVEQQSSSY